MPRIIMNRGFIARWTRMPHSTGRLSASVSSHHSLSSAAFITNIAESDFRHAQAKRISERVKAGMARARAQGKHLGRPAISFKLKHQIAERIAAGETAYAVAKALGIDRHTAQKYA